MSKTFLSGKTILITGGTGSWGHELVRQLLEKYSDLSEIRIYSRGEHKQVEMCQELGNNSRLRFIIGDVRDKNILRFAMLGVNVVFHLAALKHVPVCEDNPWEAVLTNIIGTQNVIEAAIQSGVEMVVDVSTDKAVEPFNLYGVTKACGEKLMVNANANYAAGKKKKTKFICIRGGNIIGTNGSVIPLFKKQLSEHNTITVTDLHMTRFLMNTREAIALIFTAMEHSSGGELFVMRMPSATLETLSKVVIKLFGNAKSKICVIGARPGEKQHEVLVSRNEAQYTRVFSDKYFLVLPQLKDMTLQRKYAHLKIFGGSEFSSSNTKILTQDELISIFKKERWLW